MIGYSVMASLRRYNVADRARRRRAKIGRWALVIMAALAVAVIFKRGSSRKTKNVN